MSRLYWSNLPDANKPRGGTSGLWSSLTTDDLPMPEYPETSTNSGQQPVRRVMFAKWKLIDAAPRFPFIKTASKIARSARCCLISLLSRLGEQFHHDCRNQARYTVQPLSWRHRLARDMGVHQFHRIGRREWKSP